jgi:hypothetical protein
MKSIMALVLVALLAGCAPVYYAPGYGYYTPAYVPPAYYPASQAVFVPPVVNPYMPGVPTYVPSCSFVDRWDPVYGVWNRIRVCK